MKGSAWAAIPFVTLSPFNRVIFLKYSHEQRASRNQKLLVENQKKALGRAGIQMHHFFFIRHLLIKNGLMRRNAAHMSCHFAGVPSIYVAALDSHRSRPTLPPLESEFSELIK